MKESVTQLSDRGLFGLVSTWQTYAAISFGVLGIILVQAALHAGRLVAAQPGITLMDPLVSTLWGVLVFNEQTRTGIYLGIAAPRRIRDARQRARACPLAAARGERGHRA